MFPRNHGIIKHAFQSQLGKTNQTKGEKRKMGYELTLDNSENFLSLEEVLESIKDKEEIKKAFNG